MRRSCVYDERVRIRGHDDELDDLVVLSGDTRAYRLARSTEASFAAARAISNVFGAYAPIIDRYLEAFSFAPAAHLAILARRGARIVFAPTIDVVLTSRWAEERRGRPLTMAEARQTRVDYGPESGAAGVYDAAIDALVLPTSYCCRDLNVVVRHELGHALTLVRARISPTLIRGLPGRLHRHVFSEHYVAATPLDTLRERVLEALAEGYSYIVDGRGDELPGALASELTFMLQTVEEGDSVRFDFERTPDGDRTASRVSTREIIDATHPEHGHLFAPVRVDPGAELWELTDDELAPRRRQRDRAA